MSKPPELPRVKQLKRDPAADVILFANRQWWLDHLALDPIIAQASLHYARYLDHSGVLADRQAHTVQGDLSRVNRVEVIAVGEANARKFITYDASHVRMDMQDHGRTLKIFYNQKKENNESR